MCWNFTNLRVEPFQLNKNRGSRIDVLGAKSYFGELFERTGYTMAGSLRDKIDQIELSELASSQPQQNFLIEHKDYLDQIENYSAFEFELLNSGRSIKDVRHEIDLINKLSSGL
jgi:ABC-type Fe3+-citrate transport system substrate-binding protein